VNNVRKLMGKAAKTADKDSVQMQVRVSKAFDALEYARHIFEDMRDDYEDNGELVEELEEAIEAIGAMFLLGGLIRFEAGTSQATSA